MNLELTSEQQAFCEEVRAFAEQNLPPEIKHKVDNCHPLVKEDYVTWQKIVFNKGWIAPDWPEQYGGCGWDPVKCYLFEEELALASAPRLIAFGLRMLGPVLMKFGFKSQQERYLPKILSSDEWWSQGYSEPNAGSDLASLKCRAVPDGDHYIVNGAKTWTTYAQYGDWIFCLVRTSDHGKKQEGISFLLIDMTSQGVSVRPIKTFEGGEEINEVFFDDVRVPKENLVGKEGQGWDIAKYLLEHERAGIALVGRSKRQLQRLKEIAAQEFKNGKPLIEDMRFRDRIAAIEIDLMAVEYTSLRIASDPGAQTAVNMLKIKGTEVQQMISELLLQAIGYYGHPHMPEAQLAGWNEEAIGPEYANSIAPHYFNWRKTSIFGGTNEIQKSIIAKQMLGF